MAKKSRAHFEKRQKELARQEKQKKKAARRLEAKERPAGESTDVEYVDPDLEGIEPGPQPVAEDP